MGPPRALGGMSGQRIGRAVRRQAAGASLARCYTDVNTYMPKNYWDYEGLTVQWGYVLHMND